jgi:hypothetical protein
MLLAMPSGNRRHSGTGRWRTTCTAKSLPVRPFQGPASWRRTWSPERSNSAFDLCGGTDLWWARVDGALVLGRALEMFHVPLVAAPRYHQKGRSAPSLAICERKFERVSRRRAGRPSASGKQTGLGRGPPHAICLWFRLPFPSIGYGWKLEVSPFDFHGDRSAARVRFVAPPPDIICHLDHARFDPSGIGKVPGKVLWRGGFDHAEVISLRNESR